MTDYTQANRNRRHFRSYVRKCAAAAARFARDENRQHATGPADRREIARAEIEETLRDRAAGIGISYRAARQR